jgi:hypothetical protein
MQTNACKASSVNSLSELKTCGWTSQQCCRKKLLLTCRRMTCQDLREILTARGVRVRKARGLQIYTSLLSCEKQAIYVP